MKSRTDSAIATAGCPELPAFEQGLPLLRVNWSEVAHTRQRSSQFRPTLLHASRGRERRLFVQQEQAIDEAQFVASGFQ